MPDNVLYYGDNLDILRRYIADESVDLIYLDPPFNSNASYNVLFSDKGGTRAAAQLQAFKDTWSMEEAAPVYQHLILDTGPVGRAIRAFGDLLPHGGLLAYLVMMAPRLAELHRVLKPTGSLYLHCDPTASHYLKVLLDVIFGAQSFGNEIVWKRTRTPKTQTEGFGGVHDVILRYTGGGPALFVRQWNPLSQQRISQHYSNIEPETGRHYMLDNFSQAGAGTPRRFGDQVLTPPDGKHWIWGQERIDEAWAAGRLVITSGGTPRVKRYLDESRGQAVDDVWIDIPAVNSQAAERLGYPTQKPEALLERILSASSNEGDLVLDPFCGCGTTVAVAQRLGRRWVGIDITQAAIVTMRARLAPIATEGVDYDVVGEPTTVPDAAALAREDPYQFQWWALGLVGARPDPSEQRKGADRGIDGRLYFDDTGKGTAKQVILSVKGGKLGVGQVQGLRGVLEREGAEIAVLICMLEPTGPMIIDAAQAGIYQSPLGTHHPRLQILTIAELLAGKKIDMPHGRGVNVTFAQGPKRRRVKAGQGRMDLG